jgi:carbohydrate kinase (thermoresistant glucokinase family)
MDSAPSNLQTSAQPRTCLVEGGPLPSVLVVMGVSGSGKSTIGTQLALALHWEFEDGDWFHPARNIDKMHAGIPLTDGDRAPWLIAIADFIDKARLAGSHVVIACSALKRRYRAVIIGNRPDVQLVYLKGDIQLISRRISTRHEHFMPPTLLESQFEALEEPGPDEHPIVASIAPRPREIVMHILADLQQGCAEDGGAPASGLPSD